VAPNITYFRNVFFVILRGSARTISALIYTRKQSVVLLLGLLLIAAQLVSLVHAADHPFHEEDEVCAAFASFEQHDHAIAVLPAPNPHPHLTCKSVTGFVSVFVDQPFLIYQSRAPPLRT
jgi:hypothetical protein